MDKIKAAVLHAPRDLRVELIDKQEITRPDEVIVKVKSTGICVSDVHYYDGTIPPSGIPPFVPGHEFSGEVAEVGEDVKSYKVGDRVTAYPSRFCGECYYCRIGKDNLCENRVHTGSFREYLSIPSRNLVGMPESVSYDAGALTEPFACCVNGITQVKVQPGDTVTIIGGGPMGLMHLQLIRNFGAGQIIVSEPQEYRTELAYRFGADVVVNPLKEDLNRKVRELTDGRGSDVVIETAGSPSTAVQAIQVARSSGRIELFSMYPEGETMPLNLLDLVKRELKITGVIRLRMTDFVQAAQLMANNRVDAESLISHKVPLDEIVDAIEMVLKREDERLLRVIVNMT